MISELQKLFNSARKFKLSETHSIKVSNGLYALFEKDEVTKEGLHRIVRIGINESKGRFVSRLNDHFTGNHRGSIFRKHVGRCFLVNARRNNYLPVWNLTNKQLAISRERVDQILEDATENEVSDFINSKCYFAIVRIEDDVNRIELEKRFISTLGYSDLNKPTKSWLGSTHPDKKIIDSGLWNVQHLKYANRLSESDFNFLKGNIVND